jgi:hypothetical protein
MKLRKSPNSLLGKIRTGQTRCDSLSISQHTPCRLRILGWPRRAGCRDTSISARMALQTFASFSYFSFASRELNSPWTVEERDRGYSNPYLPLSLTIRLNAKLISKFTRAWLMMAVPPSPRDSVSGCQVTDNINVYGLKYRVRSEWPSSRLCSGTFASQIDEDFSDDI